jgi:MFS family permease
MQCLYLIAKHASEIIKLVSLDCANRVFSLLFDFDAARGEKMKENIWNFIFCVNKKSPISSQDELSGRAMAVQVAISLLANMSVLSPGMGLGYPAITSQLLRQDETVILNESQVSWFASITAIACPCGGPVAAYCTNRFGRKGTLIIIDFISIASWLIIGFSSRSNADTLFVQLMVARFLTGITIGMITTPAVMYSSEICHQRLRGRLTVLSTPFFIAVGMLVVYLLGYLMIVSRSNEKKTINKFIFTGRLPIS